MKFVEQENLLKDLTTEITDITEMESVLEFN